MALATTSDYALALNELFYYWDNVYGGIDWERIPIYSHMLPEDALSLRSTYLTYKTTRDDRPASELAPDAHGANQTTVLIG